MTNRHKCFGQEWLACAVKVNTRCLIQDECRLFWEKRELKEGNVAILEEYTDKELQEKFIFVPKLTGNFGIRRCLTSWSSRPSRRRKERASAVFPYLTIFARW